MVEEHANSPLDELVGPLDADRLCPGCQHQIGGLSVHRDRRLGLLHVRCTECGRISAVHEYPMSWRWLRRFGFFVAAICLVLAFGLLALDVSANAGSSSAGAWQIAYVFADQLSAAGTQATGGTQASWDVPKTLLADLAWTAPILTDPLLLRRAAAEYPFAAIPAMLVGFGSGVLWAIVLLHRRFLIGLAWLAVPVVLAAGFALLPWAYERLSMGPDRQAMSYGDLVFALIGGVWTLKILGLNLAARLLGFALGRPIAHLLFRALVPTRARTAIGELWGDAPPRRR